IRLAIVLALGTLVPALLSAVPPVTAKPPASAAAPGARRPVSGVVFDDANRNGRRDADEKGIAGVVVTDLRNVTLTASDGHYTIKAAPDAAVISVSLPDGFSPQARTWRLLDPAAGTSGSAAPTAFDVPLARRTPSTTFTFLHASDTHLSPASLPRMQMLRALVEERHPDFVIITGDLVRDALRVGESEARGYYDLLAAELAKFTVPVFVVPGNHDIFGIERAQSLVSRDHPMYGR